jgi:tetratricopeptide (TPR) repeat protein
MQQGKLHEARELLAKIVHKHPDSIAAHFQLGQVNEQLGDLDGARTAYAWFVEGPDNYLDQWLGQGDRAIDNAEDLTLIGRAIDRWACLTGAYQSNRRLHDVILDMFVRSFDVIDRSYWPAHLAAAEYFLSHDDKEQAIEELKSAHHGNPNDPRSIQLAGTIALMGFNFDAVDSAVRDLRKINRHSIAAELLLARNLLLQRTPKAAYEPINRVLDRQPENLEALGLLAAAHALQLRDSDSAAVLRQVDSIDPDNATAYFEVAEQLAAMRQYPRSADMYQVAIDRAPWWTAARNGLGLLYTQSGDEQLAHETLDAAHALDPFNVATTNYLRLLDNLESFARKETEHFVVMYDEKLDPMIPEYFAEYLESIHAEVCATFQHEPAVKTYIEVFPTHAGFSVRTTGAPWIGTVGASTGRVIALVAPRKGPNTMGPFNWAQVLRHEYTHTVTLSATDNRIPHWMTEGLAVVEEHAPLRWEWIPMLYHAVTKNELFTMENLTWGFVRPRKPMDRQLAYAQSYWVCKYIEDTYGHEAILAMLDEYRKGENQDDVFPKILGRSLTQFTDEFFAWTRLQVAQWGYDEQTSAKYEELREHAENLVKSKQYAEALKAWLEIVQIRPVDSLPHQRLAGLYLTREINQPGNAIEHLIVLHSVELHDNRYAKRIARLYRDSDQLDNALKFGLQAVYINPYDPDAHQLLARLYEVSGNTEGVKRERAAMAQLEIWQKENAAKSEIPSN